MAARPRPNSVEYGNSKATVHCCPRLNVRVHSSKVELAAAGLCVFGGRGRRMRTLCIQRTLSRHVTIGTATVIFAVLTVFWLFLTIGTLLLHCWYRLGRHVTIGTPMVISAVLTVSWLCLTVLTITCQRLVLSVFVSVVVGYVFGYRYLGDGDTDRGEILHDVTYRSRTQYPLLEAVDVNEYVNVYVRYCKRWCSNPNPKR